MNLETLHRYYEDGLLYKQTHPSLPLTIWNYTEKVQYEGLWDDVTLQCRGLITDDNTGEIIIRPFRKFFNYEELVDKNVIPTKGEYVYIQEKVDGSLGILFNYEGEWIIATRGSFTSEQAVKGLEIVKNNYSLNRFHKEYVYLVEIIYPENKIVVDYGEEKVIFLSVVLNMSYKVWNPTDETELHWITAKIILYSCGVDEKHIVNTEQYFNFSDELYKNLKDKNENNKEGFVLRFYPTNFRMKIKFEEYVRLHKIMTNLSTTAVWEVLSNGGTMDSILKNVPDEFYDKIKEYENELIFSFNTIKKEYDWIFNKIRNVYFDVYEKEFSRAEFAMMAKKYKYPSILFALLDNKNISPIIWKIIKPNFKKL